jgi:hypothetical protein
MGQDKMSNWPFFYLVCETSGIAATRGLLCQPQVIVKIIVEKQMECRLAGETEVLGENLHQDHFCPSQNPTWWDPGLNPGRRGGKPAINRLSYGAAHLDLCCITGDTYNGPYSIHDSTIENSVTHNIIKNFIILLNTCVFLHTAFYFVL